MSETSYVAPNRSRHYDQSPGGRMLVIKTDTGNDPNTTPVSVVVVEHGLADARVRVR